MDKSNNTSEVLTWMKSLKDDNPDILFRGQNKEYNNVGSSMFRQSQTKQAAVMRLCAETHRYAGGITGYSINDSLEELGLIQHYLELSPMLDLTGTPEIALYFALLNSDKTNEQIIYAFDSNELRESNIEVVNHDFLLLPINQQGYQCRWIKQDGYGVCLKEWKNIELSKIFNLLDYNHQMFKFYAGENEWEVVQNLGNLLDIKNDKVAERVFNFLHLLSGHLGIQDILSTELNKYGFQNPKKSLNSHLDNLIEIAKKKNLDLYLPDLNKLIKANNKDYWDTSFDAMLDYIEKKLKTDNIA